MAGTSQPKGSWYLCLRRVGEDEIGKAIGPFTSRDKCRAYLDDLEQRLMVDREMLTWRVERALKFHRENTVVRSPPEAAPQ